MSLFPRASRSSLLFRAKFQYIEIGLLVLVKYMQKIENSNIDASNTSHLRADWKWNEELPDIVP